MESVESFSPLADPFECTCCDESNMFLGDFDDLLLANLCDLLLSSWNFRGESAGQRHIDVADLVDIVEGLVGTLKLERARKESRLKGEWSAIDHMRDQIVTM